MVGVILINKKNLENQLSPRQDIGYFTCFILASGPKIKILYFTSPRTAENGSSDLSQGEVNRNPRPKDRRIFTFKLNMENIKEDLNNEAI